MNSDFNIWLSLWLSRLSHDLEVRFLPSAAQLFSRDAEAISRMIDAGISDKQNIFFGVLGREGKIGGKAGVQEAHCLWADIDFKDLQDGQIEADGIVATFDHAPSLQIVSGGGYHLYWFLETPTTELVRVERILRGIVPRLKSDPKVAQLACVLRPPGTLNFKYDPPRTVEVVFFDPKRLYSLDDFKEWEQAEKPREETIEADPEEKIDLKRYLKHYKVLLAKVKKQGESTFYCLKKCLFAEDHTTGEAEGESAIGQQPDGKLFYHCFHSHCANRTWAEVRLKTSGTDSLAAFRGRELRPLIERYVEQAGTQQFTLGAMTGWLDIKALTEREETMTILEDLERRRVIIRAGNKHGTYRGVDKDPHVMKLWAAKRDPLNVILPFNLHKIVKVYPKNVILVAGEKDAGKTAFALNTSYMNRDVMKVRHFNSEMGVEELEARLTLFNYSRPEWDKITWIERANRFEDLIDPDGFNIIDFLEVGADAYAVVEDIKRVFDRLTDGLLLIVMQKRSYKEWAVGGEGTLEKARLAVNLKNRGRENVCRITVAKNWTGEIAHPKGYECQYKVWSGGRMEMTTKRWYDPDIEEAIAPKSKKLNIVTKKGTEGVSTFDDTFVHGD
jgi:hypothetical protein